MKKSFVFASALIFTSVFSQQAAIAQSTVDQSTVCSTGQQQVLNCTCVGTNADGSCATDPTCSLTCAAPVDTTATTTTSSDTSPTKVKHKRKHHHFFHDGVHYRDGNVDENRSRADEGHTDTDDGRHNGD